MDDCSSESKIQTWLLLILPRDNERIIGRLSKILYAVILNNQNLLVMEPPDEEQGILLHNFLKRNLRRTHTIKVMH